MIGIAVLLLQLQNIALEDRIYPQSLSNLSQRSFVQKSRGAVVAKKLRVRFHETSAAKLFLCLGRPDDFELRIAASQSLDYTPIEVNSELGT
jgi:hypothetical protein